MTAPTTPLEIQPKIPAAVRVGMAGLVLFSLGHFFIDLYSAAIGVYQPVLVDKLRLSLTQAGIIGGVLSLFSSVMQPLYGFLSDRFHSRMFSALAPAVAGIFISAFGLAPSFGWVLFVAAVGGAGIASFHPQASARATLGIERNRGRWMAVFISAGTLGLAAGPIYFSTLLTRFGPEKSAWAAAPGVLMTVLLLARLPETKAPVGPRAKFDWRPLQAVWRPLTILYFLVFIRSVVQISFSQFLPLYLHRERGFTLVAAGLAVAMYQGSGAIGGFTGGHLADRFGGRKVILISMAGSVPFLILFYATTGPISIVALALGGLILLFTVPINVVMAQELAPKQSGTVSALMMGFAWGMAGVIFIPLTGWMAQMYSLHHALAALTVFPVIGFFLALKLPKTART